MRCHLLSYFLHSYYYQLLPRFSCLSIRATKVSCVAWSQLFSEHISPSVPNRPLSQSVPVRPCDILSTNPLISDNKFKFLVERAYKRSNELQDLLPVVFTLRRAFPVCFDCVGCFRDYRYNLNDVINFFLNGQVTILCALWIAILIKFNHCIFVIYL